MNPSSEPNELHEVQLQEANMPTLNDTSLPAGQVIAEQNEDAEEHLAHVLSHKLDWRKP